MSARCGACGNRARKLQRATVLLGPGKSKVGRVCAPCARGGWLLVLGNDAPEQKTARASRRARAAATLERWGAL